MPFLHFIAHEFATRHFLLFAFVAAGEGQLVEEGTQCIRHLNQRMRADKLSTVGRLKKYNYNNN